MSGIFDKSQTGDDGDHLQTKDQLNQDQVLLSQQPVEITIVTRSKARKGGWRRNGEEKEDLRDSLYTAYLLALECVGPMDNKP